MLRVALNHRACAIPDVRSAMLVRDQLLSDAGSSATHVVAGAIEWYSWRELTLTATGWERTAVGALEKGRAPWRNCSPTGSGWTAESGPPIEATFDRMRHDKCFGPLPFFKGAHTA